MEADQKAIFLFEKGNIWAQDYFILVTFAFVHAFAAVSPNLYDNCFLNNSSANAFLMLCCGFNANWCVSFTNKL